ncbi:hypothetical protein HGO38_07330 [Rhizobium sp. CG5]|uniref:hypothetical protein n=1 Tax=Rhizobium sp. CG5 TaxID=2726076 RepID=UPI0020333089|nr:hypothetical protein [Rhizobium sp. CG5]MCM2473290.1 hypothetical protein [Rhizobium sp. CG5]
MTDDRAPTVINTGEGGAGWAVALILAVLLALGAFFVFSDGQMTGGGNVNVNVAPAATEAPAASAPSSPAPATPAPAAPAPAAAPASN